jgi:hypothetical protein
MIVERKFPHLLSISHLAKQSWPRLVTAKLRAMRAAAVIASGLQDAMHLQGPFLLDEGHKP